MTTLPEGVTTLTAAMLRHPGVSLHRRPASGSILCWGKCGRRISANAALCRACAELQQANATAPTSEDHEPTEPAEAILAGTGQIEGVGVAGGGGKTPRPAEPG